MRILVTGGAGFIGSHLVNALIKKGHKVLVIDDLSCGYKKFIDKKSKFSKLNILSPKLSQVVKRFKPDIIFHLAAQKSVNHSITHPVDDVRQNIIGSIQVAKLALASKAKKFIFFSTGGAIYGEAKKLPTSEKELPKPTSPYGLNKLAVDNYLENFFSQVKGLKFVSLRLANVYGPRQDPDGEAGVIAIFVNNLLKKQFSYINGSGRQTRDFIYVGDVVKVALKAISKGSGIYNVGTGKETSILDLYRQILEELKGLKKVKFRSAIEGEIKRSVLDIKKVKRELGWQPKVDLKLGIKKTIEYFK